jgi:flagellar FliL protein
MAKEDQADVEVEEGGNKKLFIIIGAAVAVVLIGAIAAFMLMGKGDKPQPVAEGQPAAESAHAATPVASDGASTVYSLDPFIVNIYDGQELRYLKVRIEMEMASASVQPELEARLAAIRDAILVVLTTKTLQEIQDVQGKNQLREEILLSVSKIVAQGKVTRIYFTDFVVQ